MKKLFILNNLSDDLLQFIISNKSEKELIRILNRMLYNKMKQFFNFTRKEDCMIRLILSVFVKITHFLCEHDA